MTNIAVTAEASKEVMPDRTEFIISHKIHRYDYEELTRAVNAERNVISSAVSHITPAKIIVDSAYSTPVYVYNDKKRARMNDGFEYTGRYTVDVPLEAQIFDDLTLALTALNLELSLSNRDYNSNLKTYEDAVIAEAVREAKAKADAIARELNKNIVGVSSVEYNSPHAPMLMRAASADNFERRAVIITESVTVRFDAE